MSRLKYHLDLKLRRVQHECWQALPQRTIKSPLNTFYWMPEVSFSEHKMKRPKMNTYRRSPDCGHQIAPAESSRWCGWVLCSGRNKPTHAGGEDPAVGWSPLETAQTAWNTPHEMPEGKLYDLIHPDKNNLYIPLFPSWFNNKGFH